MGERRSSSGARMLPGRYYTDRQVFGRETERIFLERWLYVGHVSQLAETGRRVPGGCPQSQREGNRHGAMAHSPSAKHDKLPVALASLFLLLPGREWTVRQFSRVDRTRALKPSCNEPVTHLSHQSYNV